LAQVLQGQLRFDGISRPLETEGDKPAKKRFEANRNPATAILVYS